MRWFLVLGFGVVLAAVSAGFGGPGAPSQEPPGASTAPPRGLPAGVDDEVRYLPRALHADLRHLRRTFEAVHPDLYRHTSRSAIDALAEALHAQIDEPMTARAFYVLAARLAAAFGDGHTRVDFPQDAFARNARGGAATFPFTVRPAGRGLAVDRTCLLGDAREAWPRDARIRTVNGRDADSLFAAVRDLLSGAPAYRDAVAGDQFPYLLWAVGVEAPFRLTIDRPASPRGTRRIEPIDVDGVGFGRVRGCLSPAPASPFAFRRLPDDVGLLTIRSLTQPTRFRRFLDAVADSTARRPVRGWIVDLRDNEGGRTKVAELVLGTLTARPVRLIARKEWKVSRPYQRYLHRQGAPDALRPYLEERPGRILRIRYAADPPPRVPLRLRAPVAVLVGPRTFSSAVTLAGTIQAYDLATLVGRETGGRANRFGEGYPFRLPHTRLRAMVSSAYFVQSNGDARARGGVRPDVPVAAPGSVSSDLALGAALAWLR